MYDVVIVGSGVSGGRIAYELQKGGARCLMLEAGRAFDRRSFPSDEMGYTTQMYWSGGIEVTRDGTIGLMRGKCLGGTSVLNQADLSRFDDLAIDDWRDRTGIAWMTDAEFKADYDYLDDDVVSHEVEPEHRTRNAHVWIEAMERLGYGWEPINRAQSQCRWDQGSDCIVCLGGCPRDAKQSTLAVQIPAAVTLGLEVECDWTAERLVDKGDAVTVHGTQRGSPVEATGRRMVLAAGAFGNTALLQRSDGFVEGLPALGQGFACHPQFMTFGVHDEPVNSHKGPFQSVESNDRKLREAGLKVENVFAPPIAVAMLLDGWGRDHHRMMKKYPYLACFEVAIRDENTGRIKVSRHDNMIVDKSLTAVDLAKKQHGLDFSAELHSAAGAREVFLCDTTFGLHLMGGCTIGSDPATSVVAPDFRIHGHDNVFAADSSIFPSAPGINPSYTIMALSHRGRAGDRDVTTTRSTFRSRFLSAAQFRGLQNLGDGMCPGDDDLPSFSGCGCGEHVDEILEQMNPNDLAQLRQLLTAASVMPSIAVQQLLKLAERSPQMTDNNPAAPTLRFLRLGLRGLVLSLYYSGRTGGSYVGPSPLDVIDYEVAVYTDDLD